MRNLQYEWYHYRGQVRTIDPYTRNPIEIRAMVESMVETGRMSGGYVMSVGHGITWNVPPEAVKLYLDLSAELAFR